MTRIKEKNIPLLPEPDGLKTSLRVVPHVAPSSVEMTLFTENVLGWPSVVSNTHISFCAPSLKSAQLVSPWRHLSTPWNTHLHIRACRLAQWSSRQQLCSGKTKSRRHLSMSASGCPGPLPSFPTRSRPGGCRWRTSARTVPIATASSPQLNTRCTPFTHPQPIIRRCRRALVNLAQIRPCLSSVA